LVAVAVVVGPACSEGTPHAGPSTPGTVLSSAPGATATTTGTPSAPASARTAPGPSSIAPTGSGPASAGSSQAGPSGTPAPTQSWRNDVAVSASVKPRCVRPGGTLTLTITTSPEAAIAFGAKYSDGAYGAPPPYGKGYGGSDHGLADKRGKYHTSWVVAPTAPAGAGVVDIIVGWHGRQGSAHPPFAVSGADGSC
jgi:hypothetical protein